MMKSFLFMQINMMTFMIFISVMINSIPSHNKIMHPLILCLILMMLTLFSSINMSMLNYTHWYSYIMFLIMIGGMMIIFLYFTSFISNMIMSMNWMNLMFMPIKLLMLLMFSMIFVMNLYYYLPWNNSIMEINNILYSSINNYTMYMYMLNKNISTIISMIYLLICLTLIVKITISKKITLRKIN